LTPEKADSTTLQILASIKATPPVFDIAKVQRKSVIKPYGMGNDLGWKR